MIELRHIVRFERGHDCIRFECFYNSADCVPHGPRSHGRYGMDILFVAQGSAGAVQFLMSTGWLPQFSKPDHINVRQVGNWGDGVMPTDLGYHSKLPRYDGQRVTQDACEFCDGAPCYYDGSSLNANDAMYALVNGGDAALWTFLDEFYACTFLGGVYPTPVEYAKPLRDSKHAAAAAERGGV